MSAQTRDRIGRNHVSLLGGRRCPHQRLCRHLVALLLLALAAPSCLAQAPKGTIAYIRGRSEIHTISADGTDDRLLWKHPNPSVAGGFFGINGLAWSPDGSQLAFTSGHEAMFSFLESDIYVMRPDGSDLRRITDPPSAAVMKGLPHGKVVVTLQNDALRGPVSGLFVVSVVGTDKVQTMLVPRGQTGTATFDQVADLGNVSQPIIAMQGGSRWIIPGINVFAGQTIKAPPLVIMGAGLKNFGANQPAWRPDGKEIGYILGSGVGIYSISTSAKAGAGPGREVAGTAKPGAGSFDWGPANAPGGPILYTGLLALKDNTVYQASVDGSQRRKRVSTDAEFDWMLGVRWLPDGSAFLYLQKNNMADSANLFRHDFATGRDTQVTHLESQFVREFGVSPDGKWVVYEQASAQWDSPFSSEKPNIWIMRVDGSGQRLLVKNGYAPSWKL